MGNLINKSRKIFRDSSLIKKFLVRNKNNIQKIIKEGNWVHLIGHVTKGLVGTNIVFKYLFFKSETGLIKREINGHYLYLDPLDEGECQPILKYGWHAEQSIPVYEQCIKMVRKETNNPIVVIDIGSNIGYSVLAAANHLNRSDTIYAVEPDPDSFSLLKQNMEVNDIIPTVEVHKIAFGSEIGSAKLNAEKKSNRRTITSKGQSYGIDIDVTTIDEFINQEQIKPENISAIQMDIEGFESEVFIGMQQFLSSSESPIVIFMELHSINGDKREAIINCLENAEFNCMMIINGELNPISFENLREINTRVGLVAKK